MFDICLQCVLAVMAYQDLKSQKVGVVFLGMGALCAGLSDCLLSWLHLPVALALVIGAVRLVAGWGDVWIWILVSAWVGELSLIAVLVTAVLVMIVSLYVSHLSWPWAGLLIVSTFLLRSSICGIQL